jgi:hypothetical protein
LVVESTGVLGGFVGHHGNACFNVILDQLPIDTGFFRSLDIIR